MPASARLRKAARVIECLGQVRAIPMRLSGLLACGSRLTKRARLALRCRSGAQVDQPVASRCRSVAVLATEQTGTWLARHSPPSPLPHIKKNVAATMHS